MPIVFAYEINNDVPDNEVKDSDALENNRFCFGYGAGERLHLLIIFSH